MCSLSKHCWFSVDLGPRYFSSAHLVTFYLCHIKLPFFTFPLQNYNVHIPSSFNQHQFKQCTNKTKHAISYRKLPHVEETLAPKLNSKFLLYKQTLISDTYFVIPIHSFQSVHGNSHQDKPDWHLSCNAYDHIIIEICSMEQ